MTHKQRLELELSEKRQRANELLGLDELTDEQRCELEALTKRLQAIEVELRAAIVTEADPVEIRTQDTTGEGAELRALEQRVSVSDYLNPASSGLGLTGAPAELNAAYGLGPVGLGGGVAIPLRILETRAVTDTTNLDGAVMQRPIFQRLFGRGILDALGVQVNQVAMGRSEYVLLTGGENPDMEAEETGTPDTAAATFSPQTLKPKRLTGRYEWTVEMAAQVEIEAALRRDLSAAITAKMSDQAINGSGSDPQVRGLLALTAPSDPSDVATYADYAKIAASAVDGIHADSEREVAVLMGTETYQHAAGVFQAGSGQSGTQAMMQRARLAVATNFLPAAASNIQQGILHAGADAMRGDSVAAMWPTMEVIRDPYSGAASGKVALTWIVLWDCYMAFRSGAYKRVAFKLA